MHKGYTFVRTYIIYEYTYLFIIKVLNTIDIHTLYMDIHIYT